MTRLGLIPKIYKIGDTPVVYVHMEYMNAWNLTEWMQYHSLTSGLNLLCNLLTFLHEIHLYGFIHRDIKPDNILVMNGRPVLLDWTLSKNIARQDGLTVIGSTMGSPMYASDVMIENAKKATTLD